jgi:hypothetical protein
MVKSFQTHMQRLQFRTSSEGALRHNVYILLHLYCDIEGFERSDASVKCRSNVCSVTSNTMSCAMLPLSCSTFLVHHKRHA